MADMTDDEASRAIDEIERALRADDAAFVERLQDIERHELLSAVLVMSLLTLGAVFLTAGLAVFSAPLWGRGLLALIAAVLVDRAHEHRRTRGTAPGPRPRDT